MSENPEAISELSFEAALKRLEEIVRRLESGDASLDESIELYGEGDKLRQQCEARLQAAQAKIEKIQLGRDGQPAGPAPTARAAAPRGGAAGRRKGGGGRPAARARAGSPAGGRDGRPAGPVPFDAA